MSELSYLLIVWKRGENKGCTWIIFFVDVGRKLREERFVLQIGSSTLIMFSAIIKVINIKVIYI